MPTDKTPEQQVSALGATLTNLAERMGAGEDPEVTVQMLTFCIKKLRAVKLELQG